MRCALRSIRYGPPIRNRDSRSDYDEVIDLFGILVGDHKSRSDVPKMIFSVGDLRKPQEKPRSAELLTLGKR